MLSIRITSACFALAALIAAPASASVLYYGGDPSQFIPGAYYEAYNELSPSGDIHWDFDNLAVPTGHTWTVTGMFEQMSLVNPANPPVSVNWQIRTGLTTASMGTLVASGSAAPTFVPNGFPLNGVFGETLSFDLSTPLVLAGGQTYWLGIQPVAPDYYHTFVGGSTDHANAVGGPLNLGTVLFSYSVVLNRNFIQTYAVDLSQGVTGIDGTLPPPSVPEAPALAIFAAGLGLLRLRHKKHLS